jgi:hypothetical protein
MAEPTTAQEIAASVREERRRQGLDQRTLALVADVISVHNIEHAKPTVRLDTIERVLTALGLRLEVRSRR